MKPTVLAIAAFSLFGAWLLSFAYEGQIFYSLAASYVFDPGTMMLTAILLHAAGLFSCGFIARSERGAKRVMLLSAAVCAALSIVFFFPPSGLWTVALPVATFFAGWWNAAWGWFYKNATPPNGRMTTVAASIVFSTTTMVVLNMLGIHLSPFLGLAFAVVCLGASLAVTARLPVYASAAPQASAEHAHAKQFSPSIAPPMILLCLFIVIITINAGLMFQVVNPAFAHLTWLTSWYWAIPYIVAIAVFAVIPRKINRVYILFAAIAMMGFSFIAFFLLDRSEGSYLVVNSLLLSACGLNDLFWWTILGELLEFHKNPARILGLGLSINVGGVLLGELISGLLPATDGGSMPALVGLAVVFVALVILPPLYQRLTMFLKTSAFFSWQHQLQPEEQQRTVETLAKAYGLTGREQGVAALLLRGYTYRMIAQELYLSESTVRTHIQNIYFKLDVRNKTELIQKLAK